jgi:hypothetical protein
MGDCDRSGWSQRASGAASRFLRLSTRAFAVAVLALSFLAVLAGTRAKTSEAAQAANRGVTVVGNQFYLNGRPFVPHGLNSVSQLSSPW